MRIGELAAMAGVTPRTVRHYHRIGLLPEPERKPNGYRSYGLRDAVRLSRIRRLTGLGLSLDEVAEVLEDGTPGADLHEVLTELDAELARQEDAIRRRRARIAELIELADAHPGGLPAEAPVSPELNALFAEMAEAAALLPGPEPAAAARERELLAMLESSPTAEAGGWLAGLRQAMGSGPEAMHRAYRVYERMDELADAAPDDPRVGELARAIAAMVPDEVARAVGAAAPEDTDGGFAEAFFAAYAPAQAEAVRQAVALVRERAR
ncbi:MerR family transcriptional regulator [Streptomyces sp. YIM 98790]|uniref:MerR family transcriptional regulator n=1 Tax=Streptomyces sp. YIM 98790 TaxID=2689077 RepID=UPI00140B05CD|nr:MerR family transcriptional regulator [Streptomyces sp. YIM 98790]